MTDNAEADSQSEELNMVRSLQLEANTEITLAFDGTTTLKLESLYFLNIDPDCSNDCSENWQLGNGGLVSISMTCNVGEIIDSTYIAVSYYLPLLGGQACDVTLSTTVDAILVFSEANLASL